MSSDATLTLNTGHTIPSLGLGVWRMTDEEAAYIVSAAITAGYRHIDTAQGYHNEQGVGEGLRRAGIGRGAVFVTSKLRTRDFGYDNALRSFDETAKRLALETLDLFLIHWPMPAFDLYVETWKALVALHREGRIASVGVSNFLPEHIERIADETGVLPAVNQLELHPYYQQRDVRNLHAEHGIVIESYSPLGGNGAPILADPAVKAIADKHGRTPAQIVIRWHIEEGLVVLPKTANRARLAENADVFAFSLDGDDMTMLRGLDRPDGKTLPHPKDMNDMF
ncbi:aldo/keto reductase [Pelagibacterium limicola]|uniref:aldo/keto reductase n=1 Tax=Pelagibacterium limicola TaxID=2791022 RepID=UPI0018AFF8DD|nr:aldo/keto reductase [Pelagibacterium limicola]